MKYFGHGAHSQSNAGKPLSRQPVSGCRQA